MYLLKKEVYSQFKDCRKVVISMVGFLRDSAFKELDIEQLNIRVNAIDPEECNPTEIMSDLYFYCEYMSRVEHTSIGEVFDKHVVIA